LEDKNMPNEFDQEIKILVAEVAEVSVDKLDDPNVSFSDLDVDSMKALEIAAAVEKKYKIIIPEGEIPKIKNLAQVIDMVKRLKG